MGNPPSWALRFGITAIGIALLLLLTIAWFVRYPDVQTARAYVTTQHPPIRIVSPVSGKIAQLFVQDQQMAEAGTQLAVLESPANWQDVLLLEATLQKPMEQWTDRALQLGPLQPLYSNLAQNWKDYRFFSNQHGTETRVQNVRQQIEQLQRINEGLLQQKTLQEREIGLAKRDMERQQQLQQEGIISKAELEKSTIQYLAQERQLEGLNANFANNDLQIKQLEGQIFGFQQTFDNSNNSKYLTLKEDANRLLSAIGEWKKTYLITAPIGGRISLSKVWSTYQPVTAGDEIAAIVPTDTTQQILVKAQLPLANSGKVQPGMKAQLRLDGYSSREYGVLKGHVASIALLPQQDYYNVEIALDNRLTTTFDKTLQMRQEMQGVVRIITEDRRILDRIFNRFRELLTS